MKERGMIFNSEMVRALLDGRKTQTRRSLSDRQLKMISVAADVGECYPLESGQNHENSQSYYREWCPFGAVGDRIWVRETWAILGNEDGCCIDWEEKLCKADERSAARIYRASCEQRPGNYGLWSIPDDADWKPHTKDYQYEGAWRPSIHMPRWASRITLEITDVRVERLNSISEEDARAEGIIDGGCVNCGEPEPCSCAHPQPDATDAFAYLWQSIYGQENWDANPFVWVIQFERVEGGAA